MRTHLLFACVIGVLMAGPAQARQPDAIERPWITAGPLDIRPRLIISNVGVDNNVFNEFFSPKRDFTLTASPDVELVWRPGPLRLSAMSGADFVYFHEYASERSTNRRLSASAEVNWPFFKPFATYSAAHTSARAGDEVDVRARRHPRTVSGGSRFAFGSRNTLSLGATRSIVEYDSGIEFRGVELADTLNSSATSVDAVFAFEATPLTTISFAATSERTRFERSPERDSRSYRLAPRITISPFGLLTGTAAVGYRRFEGRSSVVPSYSGLYAEGSLGMALADRYRLETTFARDVRHSYEAELPYFVQTGGRLTLATYLFRGIEVQVLGGRETMRYRAFSGEVAPGRDLVDSVGGGLGYHLAHDLKLLLLAEFRERTSARDITRQYRNDRIFATLTWGAPPR